MGEICIVEVSKRVLQCFLSLENDWVMNEIRMNLNGVCMIGGT